MIQWFMSTKFYTNKNGNTLNEQITIDEQQEKLRNQIAAPESKMRKEKQPRKKLELHQQILELKKMCL